MASLALNGIQAVPQSTIDSLKEPTVIVDLAALSDDASASSKEETEFDGAYYPHPTDFVIDEHPIDEVRELKVDWQQHCNVASHAD